MLAVLVSAVLQARAAAQRMQCRNNLRQIGFAVHNYQAAHTYRSPLFCTAAMHALFSQPSWKLFGDNTIRYLALGSSSWVYFFPFVSCNFIIARGLHDRDYLKEWLLVPLSLITCLLISYFFAVGNFHQPVSAMYPLSAGISYTYGLVLYARTTNFPARMARHVLLVVGWVLTMSLTVMAGVLKTRQMLAELPDEQPSECFIVSAAACGHRMLVRSTTNRRTGITTNRQLQIFRRYERWLKQHAASLHHSARNRYNVVGPAVAQKIRHRWQADLVYFMLKPPEYVIWLCLRIQWPSDTLRHSSLVNEDTH